MTSRVDVCLLPSSFVYTIVDHKLHVFEISIGALEGLVSADDRKQFV